MTYIISIHIEKCVEKDLYIICVANGQYVIDKFMTFWEQNLLCFLSICACNNIMFILTWNLPQSSLYFFAYLPESQI